MVACGPERGTDPDGPPVAVAVTLQAHVLRVGDTLTASAAALDSAGRLLRGRPTRWESSDARVVTVSPSGLVQALAPGVASIIAFVGAVRGTLEVQVVRPPAASVVVAPDSVAVAGSMVVELSAVARDAFGQAIPGVPVTWRSTAPLVAAVDAGGRVTAAAPGRAVIEASVDDAVGRAVVVVTRPSNVRLASVAPAQLVPGATVTITGTGFSANRAANTVLVGGLPATVRSATATQLAATLATGYPCAPTRDVPITVTVAGERGTLPAALQVAQPHALATGQATVIGDAALAACTELVPANGDYVVALYNATVSPAAVPFALHGAPSAQPPFPTAALRSRAPDAARLAAAAPGDTVTLHVLGASARSCSDAATDVRARTVHVGRHVAVLEDVTAPLAGTMDDDLRRIALEFDDVTYPMLEAAFGNPLAVDGRLGHTGRIALLFTRQVNDRPATLGLSFNCDLLPASVARASNEQQIVYLAVPTSAASGLGDGRATGTRDAWRRRIRAIAAHEAKHVTSYAERLARAAPFEELWLEEGSALVAEELFARAVRGIAPRANTTFRESLACELAPASAGCTDAPVAFSDHFARLAATLRDPAQLTPLVTDAASDPGAAFYGGAWWLLRWAADAHAPSDSAFFRALVAGPQTGIENLVARTGRAWPDLLGEWWLATAVDDLPGFAPRRPTLAVSSWNLRDVFAGARAAADPRFPRAAPVVPHALAFGDFDLDGSAGVRPGGAVFVELTGMPFARQLLDLRPHGAAATGGLAVAIVRVR